MKVKTKYILLLMSLCLLIGCGGPANQEDSKIEPNTYIEISAKEAKTIMEESGEYTLLDVRTQEDTPMFMNLAAL